MTTPALPEAGTGGAPAGYLRVIKAGTVDAVKAALTFMYPEPDVQGGTQLPYVSLDYPVNPGDYPGVWVDFDTSLLQTAGIDHLEMNTDGSILTRWRFQGYASFTITALNNNQCDLLFDQMIALTAFAAQSEYPSPFRLAIESSTLVSTTWVMDSIDMRGNSAAPGTPWGTDEIIYERGMAIKVIGEFVTEPVTQKLSDLSKIIVTALPQDQAQGKFIATI